jgi:hypothetical protein
MSGDRERGVWPGAAFGNDATVRHLGRFLHHRFGLGSVHHRRAPIATPRRRGDRPGGHCAFHPSAGVAVLLMVVVFVCERDYRFGAIVALVQAIVVLGAALGVRMAGAVPG